MTTVQRAAQIFGWVFLLVAILGFITSQGSMDADVETAPRVLGLFPVNLLHNLVHLAFGVWGIMAARRFGSARTYAQVTGIAYLALVLIAFVAPDFFGILPIGSHDIWLHALIALPLLALGFTAKPPAGTATSTSTATT